MQTERDKYEEKLNLIHDMKTKEERRRKHKSKQILDKSAFESNRSKIVLK
jgi:hypothetical protein